MILDKIDKKIIELLEVDGRTSNAFIAKEIGVSEGTIRRRLVKLLSGDYLHVNAVANLTKIGLDSQAIVGIKADADKVEQIVETLSQFQEVKWLTETAGQYDVFCWVALSTPSDLGKFLRDKLGGIAGLQRSETFVSLGGIVKNLMA
jgi:Lrp/AsnC family transcriptional regulator for asnA, asnC and gidA